MSLLTLLRGTCQVPGCGRAQASRGLCKYHHNAVRRELARRRGDLDRALVIHRGTPGLVVRAPRPDLLAALWLWDAYAARKVARRAA